MTTLYFNLSSNAFNAANQAASVAPTRKLGVAGTGNVTGTESSFNLDKGMFAASDGIVGGMNGAFGLTIAVKTAADSQTYRPRLARHNSAGVLQASFDPVGQDFVVNPGFKTASDTHTWSFPSVDLGTWADGDILVAGVLYAQNAGGRRGVSNVFALDGQSFVSVPW